MREVVWRLQAIRVREIEQLSFEAKLHGMEMSLSESDKKTAPVDPEQDSLIEAHLRRRQQEKLMEARNV